MGAETRRSDGFPRPKFRAGGLWAGGLWAGGLWAGEVSPRRGQRRRTPALRPSAPAVGRRRAPYNPNACTIELADAA